MPISENEILYYSKMNDNKEALQIIYDKHFEMFLFTMYKVNKKLFPRFPLDKEDLEALTHSSFLNAIKSFDLNETNYMFVQYCFVFIRSNIFKEIRIYSMGSHNILNYGINLIDNSTCYQVEGLDINEKNKQNFYEKEKLIEKQMDIINTFVKNSKSKKLKEIIDLKLQGKKVSEISKILSIPPKEITNKIYFLAKKIKRVYN